MTNSFMDSPVSTPSIQHTFSGKCVFITGVTGFLGKVLLEKLVRSCPLISQILVLIRRGEKLTSSERLQKLLESSVFDRIKLECPDSLRKVRVLDGDVTSENLALADQDLYLLREEVNFVFHCAASVRFEDNPRSTFDINFLGTKNVLNTSKTMNKLQAFVHVSTAYSFCNEPTVREEVYEEQLSVKHLERSLEWMNEEQLGEFSKAVSKTRPSLYQYSKAMAEIYISENHGELPIVIVRPAIITASAKEPFPGWIDNINGPSGFIALSCKGILKTLQMKQDVNADWVPVDLVANTLIVAAHYISEKNLSIAHIRPLSSSNKVTVVNCVCSSSNSITWLNVIKNCIPLIYKYPSLQAYRLPGGFVTSSTTIHYLCRYIYHYLPAFVMDVVMVLLWKKAKYVSSYRRVHKVLDILKLYMLKQFSFTFENMDKLAENMLAEDKDVFPIDQSFLDWETYLEDYVHGVRRFFLKEDDSTLLAAQKRLGKLWLLYTCAKMIPAGLAIFFLTKRVSRIQLLAFFSSYIFKPLRNANFGNRKL